MVATCSESAVTIGTLSGSGRGPLDSIFAEVCLGPEFSARNRASSFPDDPITRGGNNDGEYGRWGGCAEGGLKLNGVTLICELVCELASTMAPEDEGRVKSRILRRGRCSMKATTPITMNKNATPPTTAPEIAWECDAFDGSDLVSHGVVVSQLTFIETIGALGKKVGQA